MVGFSPAEFLMLPVVTLNTVKHRQKRTEKERVVFCSLV